MRRKRKPIHHQLADTLRQRIGAGRYRKAGLPPELTLMKEFDVSRHTIRSALQKLVADGLIERRAGRGRGTTVTDRSMGGTWVIGSLDALLEFPIDTARLVEAGMVPASEVPEVAALFGTSSKGSLFRLVRLLNSDQQPLCAISHMYTTSANASRVPKAELEKTLLIFLIERYCGVRAARVRQVASASAVGKKLAQQLGMRIGDPVLVLKRTYTSSDGDPILYVELYCPPDRYQHTIDFVNERKPTAEANRP